MSINISIFQHIMAALEITIIYENKYVEPTIALDGTFSDVMNPFALSIYLPVIMGLCKILKMFCFQ